MVRLSSTSAKVFLVIVLTVMVGIIAYSIGAQTNGKTTSLTTTSIVTITDNQTITMVSSTQPYNISARFVLFNNPQVQYVLYVNGKTVGTGIIQDNASIPIPISNKGNVTISTFIPSNDVSQKVEVIILQNNQSLAIGFNGINQRNNATGFVN